MATELPFLPQELIKALLELTQALENRGIRYALIGGLAAGYRSQPRFTIDLNMVLQIPQVTLPLLLNDLEARGFSFDTLTTIRQWNQEHMTVLFFGSVRIDWLKPVLPCFQHVIDTAKTEQWIGHPVRIATAESLILTKLIAFRTQDQADIESLLAANRGQLDLEWLRQEWQAIVDANDPRTARFEAMVESFYKT